MSASKIPGSDGPPKKRAVSSAEPPGQEKVLAEISHELGNFFHKLYYWSDYLKEKPARKSADATATQMLESTIRNLEGFLKASLDYFHPTQLSFVRMRVADLVEGLLSQVRAHTNGTPLTVADHGAWRDLEVLVDPGQLSRALEVAARHLTKEVGPESSVHVGIEHGQRHERPGLEVAFQVRRPNEASPLFRTAEAGVEWAVAQKVLALHGGELQELTEGREGKTVVVFLPLGPG